MNSSRAVLRKRVVLVILLAIAIVPVISHAYVQTGGAARPDVQSIRVVSDSTKTLSAFVGICSEPTGRCAEIAEILGQELYNSFNVTLSLQGLDQVADANQIILGIVSNDTIANLASSYKLNVIDLGAEGYNLISLPIPDSANDSWRILIVAANTEGVFRGAMSLLDLIKGTPFAVGDFRVRDYADHQFRGLMHWMPSPAVTKEQYVDDRKEEFRDLSEIGCNALLLGRNDLWWEMNDTLTISSNVYPVGPMMNEIAKAARYYGIEPIPQISPCPYMIGYENPEFREGEYVKEEPFIVVPDGSSGYELSPLITPFDNEANNMGFETDTNPPYGWPDGWTLLQGALNYSKDEESNQYYLVNVGINSFTLARDWNEEEVSLFQPRSLYVLESTFSNVDCCVSIGFYAKVDGIWTLIEGDGSFFFKGTNQSGVKDFFFWTPPLEDDAPLGYNSFYFDEIEGFRLVIQCNSVSCSCNGARFDGFFLERRESSLRNVMIAQDLPLIVKNISTGSAYTPNSDYVFNHEEPLNFLMRTHEGEEEAVSSFAWSDTTMNGDTVLVSYTLGVPCDWSPEGQKTRYCLSNPALYEKLEDVLQDLYTPYEVSEGTYAVNPKYIDIRLDEMRGINRCGRCETIGNTNAEYIMEYIKNIQGILDTIPAASSTSLICSSDMLSPSHNGGQPGYQYRFGGPWGETSGELSVLDQTNVKLIIQLSAYGSERYQTPVWPVSEAGDADVHIVSVLQPESNEYDYDDPDVQAQRDTWYLPDCIGFSSIATFGTTHTEKEHRWLDYAWKRYGNPDATLHELQYDYFVTDETGAHVLVITEGTTLKYVPFGNPECRDPNLGDWSVTAATINWGSGTPENVLSALNEELVTHQFNSTGEFNITLSVTAELSGGGSETSTAVIPIRVSRSGGGGEVLPGLLAGQITPFGMKSITPNPFNPITKIEFGLPVACNMNLTVYDVTGKRVASLVDGKMLAGMHTIVWDGSNDNGSSVASGVYFLRLKAGDQVQTKKLVLLR